MTKACLEMIYQIKILDLVIPKLSMTPAQKLYLKRARATRLMQSRQNLSYCNKI